MIPHIITIIISPFICSPFLVLQYFQQHFCLKCFNHPRRWPSYLAGSKAIRENNQDIEKNGEVFTRLVIYSLVQATHNDDDDDIFSIVMLHQIFAFGLSQYLIAWQQFFCPLFNLAFIFLFLADFPFVIRLCLFLIKSKKKRQFSL